MNPHPVLNLPAVSFTLTEKEGKFYFFDGFRKKQIMLTPEEWVRQHFAHYLVEYLSYPKSLTRIEGGLKYNALQKRSDILVYDNTGNPLILVECKSYQIKLEQATLDQAALYNQTVRAPWLVITNGLVHYFFSIDFSSSTFKQVDQLPAYMPG